MIDTILNLELPLWLPFLLAAGLCWSLYQLGRADERRLHRNSLCERIRRHQARSILQPLR
jgi:hypothetical protein